jgi:hypothetical protein
MAALTETEAVDWVYNKLKLNQQPVSNMTIPRTLGLIPVALREMGDLVAARPDIAQLLQRVYTVGVVSGVGDCTDKINSTLEPQMLFHRIVRITHGTSKKQLNILSDEAKLDVWQTPLLIHCALSDRSVKTRNVDGKRTTLTGTLYVYANFIPALSDIMEQLKKMFLNVLLRQIWPGAPAQEL